MWLQHTTCDSEENYWNSDKECQPVGPLLWQPSDSELLGALQDAGLLANYKADSAAAIKTQQLLAKVDAPWRGITREHWCIIGHWLAGSHDKYDSAWFSSALPSAQTECAAGWFAPSVDSCLDAVKAAGLVNSAWLLRSVGEAKQAAAKQQSDQQAKEDTKRILQPVGFAVGGTALVAVAVLVLIALAKR